MRTPDIGKLRGRSASELLDRARQGAARWLERRGLGDIGEPQASRLFADDVSASPAIRGPFFAAFEDRNATLKALAALDPDFETALRQRADRVLAGRYDLLGHRDIGFGNPVDWWLDPVAGVRSPGRHWSEIDFLNPAEVGDHKVVWELGRHNALDKLTGALARRDADVGRGFVLMSSRASFELVHKAAMAGVGLLACMSAPSSLAIDTARGLGLQLWAFVREGRATRYA